MGLNDKQKILYIQEIQSDWISKGSSTGFKRDWTVEKYGRELKKFTQEQFRKEHGNFLADGVTMVPAGRAAALEALKRGEITEDESVEWIQAIADEKWPESAPIYAILDRDGSPKTMGMVKSLMETSAAKWVAMVKGKPTENEGGDIRKWDTKEEAQAFIDKYAVPNAPLADKYITQAFRRMVRYAAEAGYDSITMTTGEQQVKRWNQMLKDIGKVEYTKDQTLMAYDAGMNPIQSYENVSEGELKDYMGWKAADRLLKSDVDDSGMRTISDLKIGGRFLRVLYDKTIPRAMNRMFDKKSWGNAKMVGYTHLIGPDGKIVEQTPYLTEIEEQTQPKRRALRRPMRA